MSDSKSRTEYLLKMVYVGRRKQLQRLVTLPQESCHVCYTIYIYIPGEHYSCQQTVESTVELIKHCKSFCITIYKVSLYKSI